MRPLRNNIIVKKLEANKKSAGGIILTETTKEVPTEGVVIACGAGLFEGGERVPLEIKVGDIIVFPQYAGTVIPINGEPFVIMKDDEVLAVAQEAEMKDEQL